jgi:hypothetical protein
MTRCAAAPSSHFGGLDRSALPRQRDAVAGLLMWKSSCEEEVASKRGWDDFTRLACQTKVHGNVVVRRLLHGPLDILVLDLEELDALGGAEGRELDVAVLFCDIRNFTTQSEKSLPYDVVYFLDRRFAASASTPTFSTPVRNCAHCSITT